VGRTCSSCVTKTGNRGGERTFAKEWRRNHDQSANSRNWFSGIIEPFMRNGESLKRIPSSRQVRMTLRTTILKIEVWRVSKSYYIADEAKSACASRHSILEKCPPPEFGGRSATHEFGAWQNADLTPNSACRRCGDFKRNVDRSSSLAPGIYNEAKNSEVFPIPEIRSVYTTRVARHENGSRPQLVGEFFAIPFTTANRRTRKRDNKNVPNGS